MPPRQRPSFMKRQKELARLQKQQEKSAKRLARKQEKALAAAADAGTGESPDVPEELTVPEDASGVMPD